MAQKLQISISNTQLNSSTSKMKYSFPKSARFSDKIYQSESPSKFYDLPSIKTKRGAGIGYGEKMDLGKKNFLSPPPDRYSLKSDFERGDRAGITMAPGRDEVLVNSFIGKDQKNPPPNNYDPRHFSVDISYSLYSRRPDMSSSWIKKVPGPGTYSHLELTNKTSKPPILSKHKPTPSNRFGQLQRKSQAEIKAIKTPGPGTYENETIISKHFYQQNGYHFPHGKRKGLANNNKVPGPGQYSRVSDFDN